MRVTAAGRQLRLMNLNETVVYAGRRYVIVGFDPMGVHPQHVYLRDAKTGEQVTPLLADFMRAVEAANASEATERVAP